MTECKKCGKKYKLERNYLKHRCMQTIQPFEMMELPMEIQLVILEKMTPELILESYRANLPYFGSDFEGYWQGRFQRELGGKLRRKVKCGNWIVGYLAMKMSRCFRCLGKNTREDVFYGFRICFDCRKNYPPCKLITKTRVKSEYGLVEKELENLESIEVENPYYKSGSKMKLYLEMDVIHLKKSIKGLEKPTNLRSY
jgi:hypothetical protein